MWSFAHWYEEPTLRRQFGSAYEDYRAYALVQDVASSWEQYERATATITEPVPEGLILHVAGPTDEGVRIIDIWPSEEAWERFRDARIALMLAALGGRAWPEATIRDFDVARVVGGRLHEEQRVRELLGPVRPLG